MHVRNLFQKIFFLTYVWRLVKVLNFWIKRKDKIFNCTLLVTQYFSEADFIQFIN